MLAHVPRQHLPEQRRCLVPASSYREPKARSPQRGTGLTTEPNELTASINNERMPVLLTIRPTSRRGSRARLMRRSGLRAPTRPSRCASCSRGPTAKTFSPREHGPVAQLDRASDFGSEGCGFKSCRDRQLAQKQGPGRSMNARGLAEASPICARRVASRSGPDLEAHLRNELQQMRDEKVRAPSIFTRGDG